MTERGRPLPDDSVRKVRYDKYEAPFEVVEDATYRKRLEELRSQSNQLNRLLQEKLEKAELPYYSWNKSSEEARREKQPGVAYPKVLRLAVLLRPKFYYSHEPKTEETRYSTGDDQVTVFFHLTDENKIQLVRLQFGFTQSGEGLYFLQTVMPDLQKPEHAGAKEQLERYIRAGDLESLTNYVVERLSPPTSDNAGKSTHAQTCTAFFKKAYHLAAVPDAQQYFNQESGIFHQSPEIIRNLGKIAVVAVLENLLRKCVGEQKGLHESRELLEKESLKLLDINLRVFADGVEATRTLASYIPNATDYTRQTIQRLIRAYKSRILGWSK